MDITGENMTTHADSQPETRRGIAAWWYTRRARAHGRYLREQMMVEVPATGMSSLRYTKAA